MFCEKCGTQNPDGARFCRHCGAQLPVVAAQPAQPNMGYARQPNMGYAQQPNRGYAQQPNMGYAPVNSPVRELLRAIGTGPLFLTGAISYTVALVCQLVAAFLPNSGLAALVNFLISVTPREALYGLENYGVDISKTVGTMEAGSFVSTLFSTLLTMTPAILTLVSIWLIFVTMRDTTGRPISTTGFTIIKVLTIIGVVAQVLVLALSEILLGTLTHIMAQYSYDGSEKPIMIVVMLGVAAAFALAILYNVQLVRTLGTMTETARTLVPSSQISVYVPVICFLGALGLLIMMIAVLLLGDIFGICNMLGLIVSQVAFGILLLSYRSKMKAMRGGN